MQTDPTDAELVAFTYGKTRATMIVQCVQHWKFKEELITDSVLKKMHEIRIYLRSRSDIGDFGKGKMKDHKAVIMTEVDVFIESDNEVICIETSHHENGFNKCDEDKSSFSWFVYKVVRAALAGWAGQSQQGVKPVKVWFMTTSFKKGDKRRVIEVLPELNSFFAAREMNVTVETITEKRYLNEVVEAVLQQEELSDGERTSVRRHKKWVVEELDP